VLWHRSLYWRIAVGFIAGLALMLVVQGILFVWMMTQAGSSVPNQPPERLAQTVAIDVAQALDRNPSLDVAQYLRQEYAQDAQPFFVVLADNRVIEIGARFGEAQKTEARTRLDAMRAIAPERLARGSLFARGGPFGRGGASAELDAPRSREPGSSRDRDGQAGRRLRSGEPSPERMQGRGGPGGLRIGRPMPIVAANRLVGVVVVPPQPPFTFLLTRYAPTLLTVAVATLIVGGVLAALVIFGPTRRRLRALEDAARRLGSGDLSARAPAGGSDEVAAVATAFNAMASELAARTEALVAADQARRQLLADVSHELNTPVTAMRGYLETLAMPEMTLDPATRARYLSIVSDETARLERMIGDLLDLARLEGGGGTLRIERVQTAALFDRVRARHEQQAAAAGVTIATHIDPAADTIAADRTRLEQALQNLAANALRYSPAGSEVRLEARSDGKTVTLLVSDQGPGIPADHLPRVFDRFYKVDQSRATRETTAGGSGLGLSIVKAIVERHGGHIAVTSVPGRTVFEITGLQRGADFA
jgi:signal transduction histidine kinase